MVNGELHSSLITHNSPFTIHNSPFTISYIDTRVAMRQGDVVHFLHSDHLGSTSLTTDATGAVVAQTRYLPYGQEHWTHGAARTDFTFTGQRAEAGFGLLDYNARYYSPQLGRFISPDTIVPEPGNPQSFNRYSYVRNNPLKFRDPTGYAECVDADCKLKINPVTGRMIGGPRIISREKWGAKPPDPASEEGFFGPSNPNGYATYPEWDLTL
jgi:RHS repeat-associated protein